MNFKIRIMRILDLCRVVENRVFPDNHFYHRSFHILWKYIHQTNGRVRSGLVFRRNPLRLLVCLELMFERKTTAANYILCIYYVPNNDHVVRRPHTSVLFISSTVHEVRFDVILHSSNIAISRIKFAPHKHADWSKNFYEFLIMSKISEFSRILKL